jgi:hypothetical protein
VAATSRGDYRSVGHEFGASPLTIEVGFTNLNRLTTVMKDGSIDIEMPRPCDGLMGNAVRFLEMFRLQVQPA